MLDPVILFNEGGPFMWGILGMGVLAAVLLVGLVPLARLGIRVPAPAWLVGPAAVWVVGAMGVRWGMADGLDSFHRASTEMPETLAAVTLSIALYPGIMAALVCATLLFLTALALAGVLWRTPEPPAQLVEVGWLRAATGRATVALLGALGLGALALYQHTLGEALRWEVRARASTELGRSGLGPMLERAESMDGHGFLLAGGLVLLAGVAAVWPVRAWLVDWRSVLGAAGVALLLGGTLGVSWLPDPRRSELEAHTRPGMCSAWSGSRSMASSSPPPGSQRDPLGASTSRWAQGVSPSTTSSSSPWRSSVPSWRRKVLSPMTCGPGRACRRGLAAGRSWWRPIATSAGMSCARRWRWPRTRALARYGWRACERGAWG